MEELVYPKTHAEEEAINKVPDKNLLGSTMYVTLEPCAQNLLGISCAEKYVIMELKKFILVVLTLILGLIIKEFRF